MKVTCLLALFLTPFMGYGKLFRVNNTLNTDKSQSLYASVKEAHDDNGVMPGDTLMIEGTIITHPEITLTKPLILIGPGYLLHANPATQANIIHATMSRININESAAGTVLIGLTFSTNYSTSAPYVQASNIIIMRCHIPNTLYLAGEVQNVQFIQNFFDGSTLGNYYSTTKFSDIVLRNNIITGSVNITSSLTTPRIFSVVEHNIFKSGVILSAGAFRSNVLTATAAVSITITSGEIQYNLFQNVGKVIPGTGNQAYAESDLFVGATGTSPDGQYKLKASSPHLHAGANGTEPGVFGGNQPYVLSGIPPLPAIYAIEADPVASKQTGLQVKIKAKSNP